MKYSNVWRFNQAQPIEDIKATERIFTQAENFAADQCQRLVQIINESAQIAKKSKNLKTRRSRLGVAQDRLVELKNLVAQHSFISLTSLDKFESDLMALTEEISQEEDNAYPNYDLYKSLTYQVPMRLSTPARLLPLHGIIFNDLPNFPPTMDAGENEGRWVPQSFTFREIGIDVNYESDNLISSDIGKIPLDGGDFLNFLIAFRAILEADNSMDYRIMKIREILILPQWLDIAGRLEQSDDDIIDQFFPQFLDTIPKLGRASIELMMMMGLSTAAAIDEAPDHILLAIKGVGPVILRSIRARCTEINADRHHDRIDMVER
ncbi:hypothetical protein [Janthinobacterium sp. UMAB-56]|uniref:hypothetical protein n=1 Tax=Janthinobacterium sp. UMAB-56 TaxID=1365361 RepID=UPI001C55A36E|nr:hypothetical protein [Janthinobacterium sp. UMAB-56]